MPDTLSLTQRQEFALMNPLNSASGGDLAAYRVVRPGDNGAQVATILAVDR